MKNSELLIANYKFGEREAATDRELEELTSGLKGKFALGASLAPATTWHIGGKADLFAEPAGLGDLTVLMRRLHREGLPMLMLGGGSNVLFADEGFRGAVVRLGRGFQGIDREGDRVRVKAATKLVTVLAKTREAGLGGVEFFAGIPGTLGGAVVGNAGAKKAWIGPLVEELTLVTPEGDLLGLRKEDFRYSYRNSSLKGSGNVLVEAVLKLKKEPKGSIERKVKEYFKVRRGKQPKTEKNAGSVFKNPAGDFAGRLTESLGLKGFRVGGARVSEVHANFIINEGGATAHDVVGVMRTIQRKVQGEYGIRLEPEVLPLGDWDWEEVKDVWWNLDARPSSSAVRRPGGGGV